MTKQEWLAAVREHNASCSGRLKANVHVGGRDWFSWGYRCPTCGAEAAESHRRRKPYTPEFVFTPAPATPEGAPRD